MPGGLGPNLDSSLRAASGGLPALLGKMFDRGGLRCMSPGAVMLRCHETVGEPPRGSCSVASCSGCLLVPGRPCKFQSNNKVINGSRAGNTYPSGLTAA